MKQCETKLKTKTLFVILENLQFILLCVQKLISFQIGVISSWRPFFSITLSSSFMRRTSWPIYIMIVEITLYPEALREVGHLTRDWKNISRSCEKPKCIPSNDQHICSIDEPLTSIIFLKAFSLWDLDPPAFMSINHTTDRESISNQYPKQQLTILEQTYTLCSFLCDQLTVKRKKLRVSFAFFQRSCLSGGQMNGTVATFQKLRDLREPGAMDRVPSIVMNSSCI